MATKDEHPDLSNREIKTEQVGLIDDHDTKSMLNAPIGMERIDSARIDGLAKLDIDPERA